MRLKRLWRHGKQMRMIEIGPDSGEPDWCEEGHAGFILEGGLKVNIDGMITCLSARDGLIIPSGERVSSQNQGGQPSCSITNASEAIYLFRPVLGDTWHGWQVAVTTFNHSWHRFLLEFPTVSPAQYFHLTPRFESLSS